MLQKKKGEMLQMESGNDYRNKCVQLMQLLRQKNIEIEELESIIESQSMGGCTALAAVEIFRKTLVTATRNSMVYHKSNVTDKKQGSIEINYRNFWEVSRSEMSPAATMEDMASYRETLQALQLVQGGSFEGGGIPSRVEGRTMRVVRIPEQVYRMLGGEGNTE